MPFRDGPSAPARIALIYVVLGAVWIGLSDWLLALTFPDHLRIGQAIKGTVFVLLGGALIYALVARELAKRRKLEAEREELQQRLGSVQRLEAIGRLTGGIAHDFNNLLTAIGGNIEAYITQERDRGAEEDDLVELQEAESATRRAEELIRQLLAFGRKQRLDPKTLDLNAVIGDMSQLLHRLIGDRIGIQARPDDDLWPITMDEAPLQQVLMNLALNARDAMPDGGELVFETRNAVITRDDAAKRFDFPILPGDYVRLDVVDTGVGMDIQTQSRIYEPFFTTKPKDVGTGLGLATVYGVMKQSGGYIAVRSAPGQGTRFELYFPKAAGSIAAPDEKPEPVAQLGRSTGTVMVVEDEPAVRSLVARTLRRHGFDVVECEDGAQALREFQNGSGFVDLILTDAVMPRLSGRELIRAARRTRPDVRTLLMTGYSEAEIEPETAYLAKPFTAAQLLDRVRQVMGGA